ncbi:MAG TPA: IS4 family transposase [Calditrichaeota bacterium]|nr:IS4 family transposase [Calditrichota bacterium]
MSYHKTIFRQMLQLNSRLDFQKIVNTFNGDFRIRKFTCWDQFIHLLFAQLSGRHSLRDTVQATASHQKKLYHLGCSVVKRSTLSDANNKRPSQIYETLFYHLLHRVQNLAPKYKLNLPKKLFMMDSTTIDLCLKLFPWAHFRKAKGAVKIHTLMQADGALPVFLTITDGSVHDSQIARSFDIPSGSIVVFDRGYHDFDQYNRYENNKIRFVTKMKTNAKFQVVSSTTSKSTAIRSDETIQFTGFYTRQKYPKTLRRIEYYDENSDSILVFLTNDFDLDAQTIADIYKARWEIELFFKTIKQNLKIKKFMGMSQNAVMTQIWIAMIAYLLITFYKFSLKVNTSVQNIFRLLQVNLLERKCLIQLLTAQIEKPPDQSSCKQLAFFQT